MMAMTSTSKRIALPASGWLKSNSALLSFSSRRKPAKPEAPSGELNSISELTRVRPPAAGRCARSVRRGAGCGCQRRHFGELEDVALAGGQSEQAVSSVSASWPLPICRVAGDRSKVLTYSVPVEVGEAVVQRQIAVGPTVTGLSGGLRRWAAWVHRSARRGTVRNAGGFTAVAFGCSPAAAGGIWRGGLAANWSQTISTAPTLIAASAMLKAGQ
jgi:hypothetical protein